MRSVLYSFFNTCPLSSFWQNKGKQKENFSYKNLMILQMLAWMYLRLTKFVIGEEAHRRQMFLIM